MKKKIVYVLPLLLSLCLFTTGFAKTSELAGISKQDYHNELASQMFDYYLLNNSMFPDDDAIEELSQQAIKNVRKLKRYEKKEQEADIQSDKGEIDNKYQETMADFNTIDKADKRVIYKQCHTTEKQFNTYERKVVTVYDNLDKLEEYYQKQACKNPKLFLDKTAGTVNGQNVSYEKYYFYYIQDDLARQISQSGGTPKKKRIFNAIAYDNNVMTYCKTHNIKVTDNAVNKQYQVQKQAVAYVFKKTSDRDNYLQTYGFTGKRFDKDLKRYAKVLASQDALLDQLKQDAKPKYADIEAYYKKHYVANEKTIIFLYHAILADKKHAMALYTKAKDAKTVDEFKRIVKAYKIENSDSVNMTENLNNIQRGELTGAFGKAAFKAPVGKTFGPVKTEYGYHVGFVYDREDDIKTSIRKNRNKLYKKAKEAMAKTAYDNIRRNKANIKMYKVKSILQTMTKK